jgi:hypothetical protein
VRPEERVRFYTELMKLTWGTGIVTAAGTWALWSPRIGKGGFAMQAAEWGILVLTIVMVAAGVSFGWLTWRIIRTELGRGGHS